jgi:hypothetical protein
MQYYENVVENVNVVENYNMDEDLLVMMVGDAVSCVFSENFELKFSPITKRTTATTKTTFVLVMLQYVSEID